jgi:hypothetical protein
VTRRLSSLAARILLRQQAATAGIIELYALLYEHNLHLALGLDVHGLNDYAPYLALGVAHLNIIVKHL